MTLAVLVEPFASSTDTLVAPLITWLFVSTSPFDVMIIPFTWSHTNLSSLSVRDQVNLECDMLGKYVVRAAELFEKTRP